MKCQKGNKVDANAVSRRRGLARSPQRGCFRRKPALQMPLSSTTLPVKMQCRTARRLPGIALIKIILPLNMARAQAEAIQNRPSCIAAGTAAHRASRLALYSSMET